MLYLKILFVAIFLTACSYNNAPFAPTGPTNAKINNSPAVQKATMRPYTINGKTYYPTVVNVGDRASGVASWYGPNFHGKKTSNGEVYNMHNMTAAHKTLPMNTIVKVTNLNNKKSVVVRINDRGPFVANRVIDLSKAAATQIGMIQAGTAPVSMEIVGFSGETNKVSGAKVVQNLPSTSIVGGEFMVQIGAFRNIKGAKIYQKEHQSIMGYKSIIREYNIDNVVIYRVFLTGFRSEEEARDFIKSGHFEGAYIIRG